MRAVCPECLDELKPLSPITPEQVRLRAGEPTTAVLVDAWGRAHAVSRRMIIGRVFDDEHGLLVLDPMISRRHASLELRDDTWFLTDLGSANGTYVETRRLDGETRLRDGERVRFGSVRFFFLDSVTPPPHVDTSLLRGHTVRWPVSAGEAPSAAGPLTSKPITIELREPSGGGGGVAVIDGKQVQLTVPQFELIALLYERARTGSSGFVQTSELVRTLSLDSAEPSEDHVRQLVRRLRRVLHKAGIAGLIESRYGAGYRLALLRA
jgi:hypothetical protein